VNSHRKGWVGLLDDIYIYIYLIHFQTIHKAQKCLDKPLSLLLFFCAGNKKVCLKLKRSCVKCGW